MPGIELEQLTSPEAGALASGGRVVGLIGFGAVEQHGPHLPLGTDAIIGRHLAAQVADRLAETVLVAPVLPGGISTHHLGFAGTVDLPPEVFAGYARALIDVMDRLGVHDVALFSAHGGNFGALVELAAEYAGHERLRVIAYADMAAYLDVMVRAASAAGLEVPETDAHAGGLETSQMLYLHGEERITIPPGLEGYVAAEPGWMERMASEGVHALSPNGVLGRPEGATAAAGEAICAALADAIAEWMATSFGLAAPRVAGARA